MKLVGPDYSRRELTAEWDLLSNGAPSDLTEDKPLILKAGPYAVGQDGFEGDSGYHVEVMEVDGSEISNFDVYPERLEFCAALASEMTVAIVVQEYNPEAYNQQNASFRYEVTKGCNVFANLTNQTGSPITMDVWTNENDGFGGFAGNILNSYGASAIAPGSSRWVHAEVPGLFAPASIRAEFGEDLAGLNKQWLYPSFDISVRSDNDADIEAMCGGGLHFPTDMYAPLEQCLRTDGSVFFNLKVTEQRTLSGCNLSVELQ